MSPSISQLRLPPPAAQSRPCSFTACGRRRRDEYRWMHDLEDGRMRDFLEANNRHADEVMRPLLPLQQRLFAEMQSWTPPDEGSAGYVSGGYLYRTRFDHGREYPVFVRNRVDPPGPEEILLDENELAHGLPLFVCEGVTVSPDHNTLVFGVDTSGDREYTLRFKNLVTGAMLPDEIAGADDHCVWANDNRTLFYTRLEPGTYRPYQIRRHTLGADPAQDPVVYEEQDDTYRCLLLPTRSRRFVLLNNYANNTEEIMFLDADRPESDFQALCPRLEGHQYEVDDDGRQFLVRTNWNAPDFRLCLAEPRAGVAPDEWREILPGCPGRMLENIAVFRHFAVAVGFRAGLQRLFVLDRRNGALHETAFPEPVCHIWLEENPAIDTAVVRIGYTSLKHPVTFYDYDMQRRQLTVVRREEVPGYDADLYTTGLQWVTARDGERVPVSLVYRNDTLRRGPAPLLIFGYGEYGTNIPVYFDQSRLPLLDRGFVYAMAHVRGGTELGARWHAQGKLRHKLNTFHDFIDCTEHLVRAGIAQPGQIYAESLSAGGLLLGAAINMRPGLFRGIYACKPFVDPLTAMCDPTLPLTSFEYDEFGHPDRRADWDYMRAYAPYENVTRQPYPHMLVTAAVNDSQVPCWEPVKWVARLRARNTADTNILLKTDMAAGHAGLSGRMERLREQAFLFAFILDLAGRGTDFAPATAQRGSARLNKPK